MIKVIKAFFGKENINGNADALALCAHVDNSIALFDQNAGRIRIMSMNGRIIKSCAVASLGNRKEFSQLVDIGHVEKIGPRIGRDNLGNLVICSSLDHSIQLYDRGCRFKKRFVVDFPVEDIIAAKDATLLVAGYYNGRRLHRFDWEGRLLQSWVPETPNNLRSRESPSTGAFIGTYRGMYFLRESEDAGVISVLDSQFRRSKILIREYWNYQNRVIVQSCLGFPRKAGPIGTPPWDPPNRATINLSLPGQYNRISLLLNGDCCEMVVSDYFMKRWVLERYDGEMKLREVHGIPPKLGALRTGFRLESGQLIFLNQQGLLHSLSENDLEPIGLLKYQENIRKGPLNLNAQMTSDAPCLSIDSLAMIRSNWSLFRDGFVVVMDATLSESGTVTDIGEVKILPWESEREMETQNLQNRIAKLIGKLSFHPRIQKLKEAPCRIQIVFSFNDQVDVWGKSAGNRLATI